MPPRRHSRIRDGVIASVLAAAALFFGQFVHGFTPVGDWLFWRYAGYLALSGLWLASCLSAGHRLVRAWLGRSLPFYAHVSIAFATGVFAFGIAMFLLGAMQLYVRPLLLLLPAGFLAFGGRSAWRYASERRRRLDVLRRALGRRTSWGSLALVAFGLLGLGMLYFLILTPDNIAYDARWKHLALAEDFVLSGGIRHFPEGWTFATRPHFGSYLYTWAFLLPGRLFDRIELAAHLEMAVFAMTTWFAIPAVVRAALPGRRVVWGVWAARFAFPGVFVYDATLGCGADHIAALFAGPIVVLMLRSYKRLQLRLVVLLAVSLAGAVLTKYSAAILLLPVPALALVLRALWLLARGSAEERKRVAFSSLAAIGALGLFTAPLWLKNLLLYGDPLYPVLHAWFPSNPWFERASYAFEKGYLGMRMWQPTRDWQGVRETLEALATFSFLPNDWPNHHRDVPIFGSLLTLLIPALLLARRAPRRLWALVAVVHAGLIPWYWLNHQDRYLQAMMPWLAATTAAIAWVLWREHGRLVKGALVMLVGLQLVWGGDAYFYQTQVFIGSPQKWVFGLFEGGFRGSRDQRFDTQEPWPTLGKAIPEGGRVLLHDIDRHLGLDRQAVLDLVPWQFGIDYGQMRSPAEVHRLLQSMGVSHLFWPPSRRYGTENLAADLMFFDFVLNHAEERQGFEFGTLVRMPAEPPGEPFDDATVAITCDQPLAPGLYRASDFWASSYGEGAAPYPAPRVSAPDHASAASLLTHAHFAISQPRCVTTLDGPEAELFDRAMRRMHVNYGGAVFDIWVRRPSRPHRAHAALAATP
jgi:hypothetical protein